MKKDLRTSMRDIVFLKEENIQTKMDLDSLELYNNKFSTLANFAQMSQMMHNVIRDKEEYNNLVEYE